jgi:hypothetical protein
MSAVNSEVLAKVVASELKDEKRGRLKVSIHNYSEDNYSSSNYGAHTIEVDIGSMQFYFSYRTIVAFEDENGLHVRKNSWGPTTGKHLNWIDNGDKKSRLSGEDFNKLLDQTLKLHGLVVE